MVSIAFFISFTETDLLNQLWPVRTSNTGENAAKAIDIPSAHSFVGPPL